MGLNIIGSSSFPVLHTIQSEERDHPRSDRGDVDLSNIVLFPFLVLHTIHPVESDHPGSDRVHVGFNIIGSSSFPVLHTIQPRKGTTQRVIVAMWT